MIAFIQINLVLASSHRELRRNLSAATKVGDLTDKTPSACKSNILSVSPSSPHPKHMSFTLERGVRIGTGSPYPNRESEFESERVSGSVRGVRVAIRTGSPGPYGIPIYYEERIRSVLTDTSPFVPFEEPDLRTRSSNMLIMYIY
ncbi:hypothetical protein AVEN_197804-1 [Araneus ventricosus]|uniref:Uncharacterized protein n=1 Tax=Araneus ventricosus TaxID=182803 RepID=A0A4Y2TTV0_ARAVE|nr:hypothetical protein AVEN_197804-1 [Araneus ventricosus]